MTHKPRLGLGGVSIRRADSHGEISLRNLAVGRRHSAIQAILAATLVHASALCRYRKVNWKAGKERLKASVKVVELSWPFVFFHVTKLR